MTRVTVILLIVGMVLGLAFALTYRSLPSRDRVAPPQAVAPAVPRDVGTSTLSHGGPNRSGGGAPVPGPASIGGRTAPPSDQPDRGR